MYITIDKQLCPQNHTCPLLRICPVGAITQNSLELPVIDQEKCIRCGKCIKNCGMQAVSK